ncbi:unnamed protein product [Miscanthus lutarioriparius]|uniref:Co-chaperone HscB C-terminal oligomerisation domain-containing protein n=1 Tax=Miscanthus lutarioriparius TaxID=422564 RepID=A0A811P5N7_9POAL|nr:unnamed protein product [Miscanthus lutarioriparius]
MWRRAGAGPLRHHLAAAAAAGCRVNRPSLPPMPTASSSPASCSSLSQHNLGILWGSASVGAPFRSLSNQSGGGGGVLELRKREYNIKDNNLEGKYKDWQKKLHPDLVHSKSEKERGYAAEQSALVIDAYRTLSKPLSRALYLLKLEGIHVDEEKTINDPELLMEMMEIREAVSDASDSQTLEKIQSQIKEKLETWSDSFQKAFDKKDFDRAVEATQRMRYYERAVEETVKKL